MGAEMNTAHGDPSDMPEEPHPFDGQFEPPVEVMAKRNPAIPFHQLAQASAAISLKRIADALDGTTAGVDISDSLCGGVRNVQG